MTGPLCPSWICPNCGRFGWVWAVRTRPVPKRSTSIAARSRRRPCSWRQPTESALADPAQVYLEPSWPAPNGTAPRDAVQRGPHGARAPRNTALFLKGCFRSAAGPLKSHEYSRPGPCRRSSVAACRAEPRSPLGRDRGRRPRAPGGETHYWRGGRCASPSKQRKPTGKAAEADGQGTPHRVPGAPSLCQLPPPPTFPTPQVGIRTVALADGRGGSGRVACASASP